MAFIAFLFLAISLLFCFSVPFSLEGEKVRFRLENRAIRELRTAESQSVSRIPLISKRM